MANYGVSEISKIIGVSRRAVYNKLLCEDLQVHILDGNKGKQVTEEGLEILKTLFVNKVHSEDNSEGNVNSQCNNNELHSHIDSLKAEIVHLREMLHSSNSQNSSLIETLNQSQKLNENNQILLRDSQNKIKLLESQPTKRNLWQWFKTSTSQ